MIMATARPTDQTKKASWRRGAASQLALIVGGVLLSLVVGCAGGAPEPTPDSGVPGCANAANIFKSHTCTTVCHLASSAPAFGGFDMTTAGWEKKLIGSGPPDSAPSSNMCKGKGFIYLKKDLQPAAGLFMDKLKANPPCGVQMPQLLAPLTAGEIDFVQSWANSIVAGGNGS